MPSAGVAITFAINCLVLQRLNAVDCLLAINLTGFIVDYFTLIQRQVVSIATSSTKCVNETTASLLLYAICRVDVMLHARLRQYLELRICLYLLLQSCVNFYCYKSSTIFAAFRSIYSFYGWEVFNFFCHLVKFVYC